MTKDKRKFTWLSDSCEPRRGPDLKKSKLHNACDYSPEVVEEWAKTGHLMFEDEPKKSKGEK